MKIPTKRDLLKDPRIRTQAELARLAGISRSAVVQWPFDKPIPAGRWYIMRYVNHRRFFDEYIKNYAA